VFQWLWKRIFSEKNLGFLYEQVRPLIVEDMTYLVKDTIQNVMEDEEVAEWVTKYGDGLYDRYSKKFWGTIGGLQKGLNFSMQQENPLNILDEDGNLSLSGIIKGVISGKLGDLIGRRSEASTPSGKRRRLVY
jgi:hypothetical protein